MAQVIAGKTDAEPIVEASGPESREFEFVIVGGGILGTTLAALAATSGTPPLVLRLRDSERPRADTLRNQGWLQSGLLYPRQDFASPSEYRVVAQKTFTGGRELLQHCGMQPSTELGVVRVVTRHQQEELEAKARILRFSPDTFRRLEVGEAVQRLEGFFEPGSMYYQVPDTPFDEARVLEYMRQVATDNGARFVQLTEPVSLEERNGQNIVRWSGQVLRSQLTVVAAGAGGLHLMRGAGYDLPAVLRRTPLLVQPGSCGVKSPLLVDYGRGFSAVRHTLTDGSVAVVIGTRIHTQPVDYAYPDDRSIPRGEIQRFRDCLPANLLEAAKNGRFTAGFEVMPTRDGLSYLEPWVEAHGSLIFSSPGRATLGLVAATETLAAVLRALSIQRGAPIKYSVGMGGSPWLERIHMHYEEPYSFDDAEA
jgi:glycine/D-amino acid oxidase-like deaminating enzyme